MEDSIKTAAAVVQTIDQREQQLVQCWTWQSCRTSVSLQKLQQTNSQTLPSVLQRLSFQGSLVCSIYTSGSRKVLFLGQRNKILRLHGFKFIMGRVTRDAVPCQHIRRRVWGQASWAEVDFLWLHNLSLPLEQIRIKADLYPSLLLVTNRT